MAFVIRHAIWRESFVTGAKRVLMVNANQITIFAGLMTRALMISIA